MKLLFALAAGCPLQTIARPRMMNLWHGDSALAARGRLELVRDSLGAACFNTASSNIYGAGRSGIAE